MRAALDAHRDAAGAPLPIAGDLCNQLGQVLYERDDLAAAAELLEQGRRRGELLANGWSI
ncbi:MAG: hypothetical protein HGA45_36915 [Chloroflexales bacterium]|nr:hypothetical protein [Chloroflexales bacterium]